MVKNILRSLRCRDKDTQALNDQCFRAQNKKNEASDSISTLEEKKKKSISVLSRFRCFSLCVSEGKNLIDFTRSLSDLFFTMRVCLSVSRLRK